MVRPRCCTAHSHPRWRENTEIDVPKCAKTCEFCGYTPQGSAPGSALRSHLKNIHANLGITVLRASGGIGRRPIIPMEDPEDKSEHKSENDSGNGKTENRKFENEKSETPMSEDEMKIVIIDISSDDSEDEETAVIKLE